jgi:hypothetical protein
MQDNCDSSGNGSAERAGVIVPSEMRQQLPYYALQVQRSNSRILVHALSYTFSLAYH